MISKKSFKLLVVPRTTAFFAAVQIIYFLDCSSSSLRTSSFPGLPYLHTQTGRPRYLKEKAPWGRGFITDGESFSDKWKRANYRPISLLHLSVENFLKSVFITLFTLIWNLIIYYLNLSLVFVMVILVYLSCWQ